MGKNVRGSRIAIEGDVEPALTNQELGVARKAIGNVRIGGQVPASEEVTLGAGFFTDRSPRSDSMEFGELSIDYYGISIGTEVSTEHALREKPGDIKFCTTVAIRYARGTGTLGGLLFDPEGTPTPRQAAVTVHELGVHVGSAVEF